MAEQDTSRVSRDSLRISSTEPPGWEPPVEGHIPKEGDPVYCTQGPAKVVRVLGRTSDGSRLLQLRCADRSEPFFAVSTNILVPAIAAERDSPFLRADEALGAG
jgi:hypothetical protein